MSEKKIYVSNDVMWGFVWFLGRYPRDPESAGVAGDADVSGVADVADVISTGYKNSILELICEGL